MSKPLVVDGKHLGCAVTGASLHSMLEELGMRAISERIIGHSLQKKV